jgi:hypothetical protein
MKLPARPANSFIIGAMHIDNDEYAVPVGPVDRNADHPGKSVTATGPIDTIAYAGPATASSLTTYTELKAQLATAGYNEVWNCARATCGSAFALARILDKPLLDTVHKGDWGFYINDDLNATNDDIRYGAFQRGREYMLIMASLQPGKPSGALVIRVNGPAAEPVLQQAAENNPPSPTAPAHSSGIRNAARSWLRQQAAQIPKP